jgi:hypothetical protein
MERNEFYHGGPAVGEKVVCYCLDEPWINPTYTVRSFDKMVRHCAMTNDGTCQHWIIVCAGSKKESFPRAFLSLKAKKKPGKSCNEVNFDNFSNWIEEQLMCNIPLECLIVLDNVTCCSVKIDKTSTFGTKKRRHSGTALEE